jgi:hypothetical protein
MNYQVKLRLHQKGFIIYLLEFISTKICATYLHTHFKYHLLIYIELLANSVALSPRANYTD